MQLDLHWAVMLLGGKEPPSTMDDSALGLSEMGCLGGHSALIVNPFTGEQPSV